jgi:ketosteroid isomerase-like protein
MAQAKELTDRFWTLFEAGKLDELATLIDDDCHFKMPGMEMRGREPIIGALAAYRAAFPDIHHTVHGSVEAGDTIAVELTVRGTHTAPMQTPQGTIPATGNPVVWESCDYIRVKRGRLVSWHVYHDPTPFLTALGLVKAPS